MSCLLFKALVRDGFRCIISGRYDRSSIEQNDELEREYKGAPNARPGPTHCAHIFPESTNANISGTSDNAADKVYFFPTYLDVFLFTYNHLDIG